MPNKRDKQKASPAVIPSRKEVPVPRQPGPTGDMPPGSKPVWRFARIDHDYDGAWSWNSATLATWQGIAEFLAHMEQLTWAEIAQQTYPGKGGSHRKHKPIAAASLCPAAQDRLARLKLDHLDDLFEFRMQAKPRLWGYVRDSVFHLIWWDPEHQVYPVEPP